MDQKQDDRKQELDKDLLEKNLEEGLKGTFPASDPPAATQPVRHEPPQKH
jgi:hypothetical protein